MSEIKGQILGIILVLTVFGAVGGTLVGIFRSLATTVENKVDSEVSQMKSLEIAGPRLNYLHY